MLNLSIKSCSLVLAITTTAVFAQFDSFIKLGNQLPKEKTRDAEPFHEKLVVDMDGDTLSAEMDGDTLSADIDGDTLSADIDGDTLSAEMDGDTLSAEMDGDTLSADMDGDTLASKFMVVGTTKAQFVNSLKHAAQEVNMRFETIFLESCNSQLATDLLSESKNNNIGQIFVSNESGLPYKTVDYCVLFSMAKNADFSDSLARYLNSLTDNVAPINK